MPLPLFRKSYNTLLKEYEQLEKNFADLREVNMMLIQQNQQLRNQINEQKPPNQYFG